MTRWFRRVVPCLRNKQLNTSSLENDGKLHNTNKISDALDDINHQQVSRKEDSGIIETSSEVEIFTENLDQQYPLKSITFDDDKIKKDKVEIGDSNLDSKQEKIKMTLISCTLHESLNDFSKGKVTHTNTRCRSVAKSCSDKPSNTLVFKTIMVDGEPSTTRYKMIEPCVSKEIFPGDGDSKLSEDIKDSKIKLVFSHEVLEHLTKLFKHKSDNALNNETLANDLVVCTLFPKYNNIGNDNDMEEVNRELNGSVNDIVVNSDISENMDVEEVISNYTDHNMPSMTTREYIFNKSPSSAQRSQYHLTSTNSVKGFQTSISKSSPHMQQQEINNYNGREIPRLRRNISKKVSWKENVEVCFFNHSSRLANEILQEVHPLIDHEVYWKECVCEMDRKRREKWLKIRADEQRCLTGDGQYHDYFNYSTHHFDDDEFRLIE